MLGSARVVVGWVLTVLASIAAGVGVEAGVVYQDGYHASSALAAVIDQRAMDAAANWGDPNVRAVTWVESTRSAAVSVLMQAGVQGDEPVYAVEVHGRFAPPSNALGPPAGATATRYVGSVLTFVMNVSDMQVTDVGIQDFWAPLQRLGTPETDSLVGLSPQRRGS